ncbi:hypothetical protein ZOSMA_454G00030 [Zostera marina]|uniref:DNA topoisomerase (ATP-hydrolyzing) n=1 Tax=Zostera marina TaxID=29655 RepID=A0A0K9P0Q1_ZOSMR|nr:hypothetical protein ZOSMA_454G00030 [Zostera marina]
MGWLRFTEGDRKVDCIKSPSTAFSVPVDDEIKGIVSGAQYILVVEKEAVFNRLANDKYCEINNCIVITGRGYPDVSTRRFLYHLVDKLCLPVYCLVDSDPYGFDILLIYRFGSMTMAYDSKLLSVPGIHWLGLLPSDINTYPISNRCLLPLTTKDKCKTNAMLKRCYLHHDEPNWRVELEIMLQNDVKFEIEALSVTSFSFLSMVYIPEKIGALKGDQDQNMCRKGKDR